MAAVCFSKTEVVVRRRLSRELRYVDEIRSAYRHLSFEDSDINK